MVADAFARKFRIDLTKHEKDSLTGSGRVGGGSVVVARPLTFMNHSGEAVKLLANAYTETLDDLIVVYDEFDLPLGKLRIRENGSAGTHNGMRSIVASLASESFRRLRFGIHGYDRTVIPAVHNAILSKHDIILLGLRGQAKTRILRSLTTLLDEAIPIIEGCEINDLPFHPACKRCRRLAAELGDDLPVAWLRPEERSREKLATPDATVADLIGDLDPITAANQRRPHG